MSRRPGWLCIVTLALNPVQHLHAWSGPPSSPRDTVYVMPRVEVVGSRTRLARIPGSAEVLDIRTLESSRVFTTSEALRKLPGLAVRDEEGLGLRPNVGIRGLNPTRSTKITMLEDGLPLAYAPYGDNASYYHPPIERFQLIELLKGAEQTRFGPQTIGGLINYITPAPPDGFSGSFAGAGGSRGHAAGSLRLGGQGMLMDLTHRQGDGARENMHSRLDDLNFKAVIGHALTLRANSFRESSTLTYSGLTPAEIERQGQRYNPFRNDAFESRRFGASGTHHLTLGTSALLTSSAYLSYFDRDWWRQSSTTTDAQGGAGVVATRLAGGLLDPDTVLSVQGRLREYTTLGVEPRVRWAFTAGRLRHELQAGMKAHFERQDRRQVNGDSPSARTGALVEDNLRSTRAYSAFVTHRLSFGRWGVTPGARYESIRSRRTNRLPGGLGGSDHLGRLIPSLGGTWTPSPSLTVFAGVHDGFAPPRTEDVIAATGTATEVQSESSTNWELGSRIAAAAGNLQVACFRSVFERLTAVGSIAGGNTPLAQGEAVFTGLEVSGAARRAGGPYLRGAYTWLPVATQRSPFRQVVGAAIVAGSAPGKRQPYAPEHLLTAAAGYARRGLDAQLEAAFVGSQFSDFANTGPPSADGQRGRIASQTVWNATLNVGVLSTRAVAYASVKNLADRTVIVDRTRGIQVGSPRLVQAGFRYRFGAGR